METKQIIKELKSMGLDLDMLYKKVDMLRDAYDYNNITDENIKYTVNQIAEHIGFAKDEAEKAESALKKLL